MAQQRPETSLELLEFPEGWSKMKDQPLPDAPIDYVAFLNSFSFSVTDLYNTSHITTPFTL